MQKLIFDEPYKFIPPHRGKLFTSIFKLYLKRFLRKTYGVVDHECRGVEHLRQSMADGHGVILAPNHCRPSDPMSVGLLTIAAQTCLYTMAGWHVFKQDRLTTFVAWRLGAFSVYREGVDRAALNCAIDILDKAERPLVMFSEGCISRSNDRLGELMEGISFVAHLAAKKRARHSPAGKVVIHPLALKYEFLGEVQESLPVALEEFETRLSWQPQSDLPLFARIAKLGRALLSLKEVEYFGEPQSGSVQQRLNRLIERLLAPKEQEWQVGVLGEYSVVTRVKNLRAAILSEMIRGEVSPQERDRRWGQLADLYLAQQLSFFPHNYLRPGSPPERILETVERMEEVLTDVARIHGPLRVVIEVGEAIEVSPQRERGLAVDPLMLQLHSRLQSMIDGLSAELAARRGEQTKSRNSSEPANHQVAGLKTMTG